VLIIAKVRDRFAAHGHAGLVGIALVLMLGIGAARVISTYQVFSQTNDEPAHIAAGIEWLERGSYTFEPLHPPLARVAVALGPYLSGLRLAGQGDMWEEGNEILLAHHRYQHNLSLARLGVLPFFLLATFLVWHWGRVRYGNGPSLLATLLFTTSPVILAHAGQATTDMALTATFTAALLAYINFLERPTYLRSTILGTSVGFALLSKFSTLVFMSTCGLALLLWRWLLVRGRREKTVRTDRFRWSRGFCIAALAFLLVVWAGYRFSVGPLADEATRPHAAIDRVVGTAGILHNWAYSVAVPAPAFFRGLGQLFQKQKEGHKAYLLGHIRQNGWWYFFPVALAVKTTLPLLIFTAMGIFYLGKTSWFEKDWIAAAPVVAALALVLVCMPSQINIGVRHILPIYPLFAIIGGVGLCRFWRAAKPKYTGPALILILLTWHLTSSFWAHPEYLAYFNELARQHPERILVDSDLDWGQDLFRLSAALRQRRIEDVSIAYAGSADLREFDLPPFRTLSPHQPTSGWIAISLFRLKEGGRYLPDDSFSWLEAYRPVCLVGRSILLYYVAESASGEREQRISRPGAKDGQ
jgi:4-amino-4-deoxy-L-arabinose transferase-like glycosyltransferase